jgi:hypothetical protein
LKLTIPLSKEKVCCTVHVDSISIRWDCLSIDQLRFMYRSWPLMLAVITSVSLYLELSLPSWRGLCILDHLHLKLLLN